jgi:hypothetical protein
MSRSQRAVIETEEIDFILEAQVETSQKPYLVSNAGQGNDNVTRRVEAVLDAQFANGSMPA